ncbi:MAG: ion transporter, partial [Kiritimatiellae bacterium]|nr:ion transporter [Kiritimatiellia bacterium]
FKDDTPAGRNFDLILLVVIVLSVLVTILDSVQSIHLEYGTALSVLEWVFTGLFALEYLVRVLCVPRPRRYMLSFLGLVDLIGWLPTIIGLLIPGSHYLTTFRLIRVLRVFRILKMAAYMKEATHLANALRSSARKILVFLFSVFTLVVLMGSLMYMIEGPSRGFTNIPVSIYWAVVTLTTVGYGDISPQTPVGQILASLVMILGYAIIAVPTGIVSAEMIGGNSSAGKTPTCPACGKKSKDPTPRYCSACGHEIQLAAIPEPPVR